MRAILFLLSLIVMGSVAQAHPVGAITSPQAGARTYAQNYKDMVLAECLATAYKNDRDAPVDAGSSVSALRDWTRYDWDNVKRIHAVQSLVESYLARDYYNPLAESEIKGIRFDFLKCLDLYHSKELDAHVKEFVLPPKRTYRQNNQRAPKFKPSSYAEFPDVQSLQARESILTIYGPNFRTKPFIFTVRQFMTLFYSDKLEDRRFAELFLAGVLDTIEGKSWCGYAHTKSISILDTLHSDLSKLDESRYNERAAYVIKEIMSKISLCKEP